MLKYSILMPFFMRAKHFANTLVSFRHHYARRNDFEVILIEDPKNIANADEHALTLQAAESAGMAVRIVPSSVQGFNPAPAFNIGAREAKGDFLVITNPECFHQSDVLAGLDAHFARDRSQYIVCACINAQGYQFGINSFAELRYEIQCWYQHTKHNPRSLHFCSALAKDLYWKIGGFDEEYVHGLCYEDADFREKILFAGIPVVADDGLVTLHLAHPKDYQDAHCELVAKNEAIYFRKWGKRT